ncbi:MAG: RDD family protein [Pseudomonadota bacterium]
MAENITIDSETGQRVLERGELDGVRTSRVLAFFIDWLIIAVLCIPFALIIGFLGILTLGLAWGLYAILPAIVALCYVAITIGGPRQATLGMRFTGVRLKRLDGQRVDPFLAVLHSVLFWVIHSFAVIIPLIVSFFSSKKRLLHDVLLGTYVGRD